MKRKFIIYSFLLQSSLVVSKNVTSVASQLNVSSAILSLLEIINDNDGYMTLKTDYRVFYTGKMSKLFFKMY